MTTDEPKRARIKAKVDASQARQKRDAPAPTRKRAPRNASAQDEPSLLRQYPWLIVGGGIAVGALIAALMPRGTGRRLGKQAMAAAAIGTEAALAFSKQARDAASEAGREGLERLGDLGETIGDGTADFRDRASKVGGSAVRQARDTGFSLAREAVKLAARVRG